MAKAFGIEQSSPQATLRPLPKPSTNISVPTVLSVAGAVAQGVANLAGVFLKEARIRQQGEDIASANGRLEIIQRTGNPVELARAKRAETNAYIKRHGIGAGSTAATLIGQGLGLKQKKVGDQIVTTDVEGNTLRSEPVSNFFAETPDGLISERVIEASIALDVNSQRTAAIGGRIAQQIAEQGGHLGPRAYLAFVDGVNDLSEIANGGAERLDFARMEGQLTAEVTQQMLQDEQEKVRAAIGTALTRIQNPMFAKLLRDGIIKSSDVVALLTAMRDDFQEDAATAAQGGSGLFAGLGLDVKETRTLFDETILGVTKWAEAAAVSNVTDMTRATNEINVKLSLRKAILEEKTLAGGTGDKFILLEIMNERIDLLAKVAAATVALGTQLKTPNNAIPLNMVPLIKELRDAVIKSLGFSSTIELNTKKIPAVKEEGGLTDESASAIQNNLNSLKEIIADNANHIPNTENLQTLLEYFQKIQKEKMSNKDKGTIDRAVRKILVTLDAIKKKTKDAGTSIGETTSYMDRLREQYRATGKKFNRFFENIPERMSEQRKRDAEIRAKRK